MHETAPGVAIVDYGMGNLYSVKMACGHVGLNAFITTSSDEIEAADAVILPGVGAFGNAMDALLRLRLADTLKRVASSGKPLFGICLGLQLLMSNSLEFGEHQGLGIIRGPVLPIANGIDGGRALKVPHVGWNAVRPAPGLRIWNGTPLAGTRPGASMYFVHSFVAVPDNASTVLSTTRYGSVEFCSSVQDRNVFACQFHPERSGPEGLRIYGAWARCLTNPTHETES